LTKGNSVELSLNSRISYHEGYKGKAPDEWLSNVLWAAGRAPITGDHRNIYVTLPSGRYIYDPAAHSLSNKTSGSSGKAAFILDYDRERDFDAGVSYMFALIGSVSMWNGTGYGNTPHKTYNGRGGLTVPSWYADHYLTENIYVACI